LKSAAREKGTDCVWWENEDNEKSFTRVRRTCQVVFCVEKNRPRWRSVQDRHPERKT
jgi:hypothetical protein